MHYKFFLFIIFSFLYSCQERTSKELAESNPIRLQIDSVSIPLDSSLLSFYSITSCYSDEKNDYLMGFHRRLGKIDFFNLSEQKYVQSIQIEKEGPKAIPHYDFIQSVCYISPDSLLFLTDLSIVFTNGKGEPLQSYFINYADTLGQWRGDKAFKDLFIVPHRQLFQYNRSEKSLFLPAYSRKYSFKSLEFYNTSLLVEFFFEKDSVKIHDLKHPDIYQSEGKFFPDFFFPFLSNSGKQVFAAFPAESSIYLYDATSQKVKQIPAESVFSNNRAKAISIKADRIAQDAFFNESAMFVYVYHDVKRNYYYRLHLGNQTLKDAEGNYQNISQKKMYLTVFNRNFQKIQEFDLGKRHSTPAFIGHKGFYLSIRDNHSAHKEDTLLYDILNFYNDF
jgi:hypothetical protein